MIQEAHIAKKLSQIDVDLVVAAEKELSLSLMNGLGGAVLYYLDRYRFTKQATHQESCRKLIDTLLCRLNENTNKLSLTYCDGLAGIGYLLHDLRHEGMVGDEVDDFLTSLDVHVIADMRYRLERFKDLDFLHGALGMGLYLLRRQYSKATQIPGASQILGLLVQLIRNDTEGTELVNLLNSYYPYIRKGKQPVNFFNVGMAHGGSAYVVFLVRYLKQYPTDLTARQTLRQLVQRIMSYQRLAPDDQQQDPTIGAFPSIVRADRIAYDVPLGWCYGDLTVSQGLFLAAQLLEDHELLAQAEAIAIATLRRDTLQKALLRDVSFCHGSSSMAQGYRLWFERTGNPVFKQGYENWLTILLEQGTVEGGIGGYVKFMGTDTGKPDGTSCYEGTPCLLDGAAGVGLVLNNYLHCSDLIWEHYFLWN